MRQLSGVAALCLAVHVLAGPLCAQSEHATAGVQPAAQSRVETGEINGAPFRIEIPANWHRGLVMYAHGYILAAEPLHGAFSHSWMAEFRDAFLARGFAFAQSAYSANGWAVKEGLEDTEALRRHFVARHGAPSETYIVGHSMGGHITIATIERYPDAYQGAFPICGPLVPAVDFFNNTLFDMLVTFEALFPGSIGSPVEPRGHGTVDAVKAAIAAEPEKAAVYARRFARPVESLPGTLAFWQEIARELTVRAGGNPFDNRNRIYAGFGDDASLNRGVTRYAADPAALAYLRLYATPTGRVEDPVLALHTTMDELIAGSDVSGYDVPAAIANTSDRFVARFVDANGHCRIAPAQVGHSFDALRSWATDGKRPEPGEQR
jgi:pimeloyl-ACP methyl ester carboxylesterase